MVVFGFDAHTLAYQDAFKHRGKKLVFEGPGADPFIVFADADLDLALNDLMLAKFMYSGQTCTAPKRIFIQQSIYDDFLARLVERVRRLNVGTPEDVTHGHLARGQRPGGGADQGVPGRCGA